MKDTFKVLNEMCADGVIGTYAIGGAIGATFYLEPFSTLDVDVFILFGDNPSSPLLSLGSIYEYLLSRGHTVEGEYLVIGGWPVQFLPPVGPLEEEAIRNAASHLVGEIPIRVMSAEHLTAIALNTGRAKDFTRILQFTESGILDSSRLDGILTGHGLLDKWEKFGKRFLEPDEL